MSRPANDIVKVAIGIVINPAEQVLVALRPLHNPHGGLWEFPGGKFEGDEVPLQALQRELYEEVGIRVLEAVPLICVQHDYGVIQVELDAWRVTRYTGEPHGREGQHVEWADLSRLLQLTFPEGNRAIVQQVKEILN